MYKELLACGLSPKRFLKGKMGARVLRHMMPKLKPLMIGRGSAQRRLSDEEIAANVEMQGGAARKKRTTPLKFRM